MITIVLTAISAAVIGWYSKVVAFARKEAQIAESKAKAAFDKLESDLVADSKKLTTLTGQVKNVIESKL